MKEFIEQASTPHWWIGVVLVGLALSVIAGYIKSWLDSAFSLAHAKWREAANKRRSITEQIVAAAANSEMLRRTLLESENRHRLRAIFYMITCVGSFLLLAQMHPISLQSKSDSRAAIFISALSITAYVLAGLSGMAWGAATATSRLLSATNKLRRMKTPTTETQPTHPKQDNRTHPQQRPPGAA